MTTATYEQTQRKPGGVVAPTFTPVRSNLLQRKCACGGTPGPSGECEGCRKKREAGMLQRKVAHPATPNHQHSEVPPIVHEVLRSSGQPLDTTARALMEPRFSHDFSQVRVHTDARAVESARAVNALAYTVGSHLVFGSGQFAPETPAGRRLIAHELAHVAQSPSISPSGPIMMDHHGPGDHAEQAAERIAQQVVAGESVSKVSIGALASQPVLQRYAVPAALTCDEVVGWLNSNSPYAPEWAETNCTYSFNGGASVSTSQLSDGTVKADVKGHSKLSVSVNCPIDRPEWNPTKRPNREAEVQAWGAMRTILDKHEQEHRKIGQTWRGTLESRFRAVNFSVTGKDKVEAMANAQAELDSQKQQWGDDAQAAQDAIDPFRGAILNCPASSNGATP